MNSENLLTGTTATTTQAASPVLTNLQILSVTLFEKVPLDQLFANYDYKNVPKSKEQLCNQLNLFDY